MKVERAAIEEVLLLEPEVFNDERGFVLEPYNQATFRESTGLDPRFVQETQSFSVRNVLRGLHYQLRKPQAKLVQVLLGEVFDVVVDLRRSSPSFGKCVATTLSAATHRMLWVPAGFAHGFLVLSEHAMLGYKMTELRRPEDERVIRWNDPDLGIRWPLETAPQVSARDARGFDFSRAECYA